MPEAEIIFLDAARSSLKPRSSTPLSNPQEKIKTAADAWLVDSVIEAAERMMGRLVETNKPLLRDERARMMRASAALLGQPEA